MSSSEPIGDRCAICLCDFDDRTLLDKCFHAFCFHCISRWAEVVQANPLCPLCKSPFAALVHAIESERNFLVERLPSPEPTPTPTPIVRARTAADRRRHHPYYPVEHRRTVRPLVRVPTSELEFGEHLRDLFRAHPHRVPSSEALRQPRVAASTEFRRRVYAQGARAKHIGSNAFTRVRPVSPATFKTNPEATARLLPWIARDLRVLIGDEDNMLILNLIMTLLEQHEIQSDAMVRELSPFFFEKTAHFLHELLSFARAPFDLVTYDSQVQYELIGDAREAERRVRENSNQPKSQSVSPSESSSQDEEQEEERKESVVDQMSVLSDEQLMRRRAVNGAQLRTHRRSLLLLKLEIEKTRTAVADAEGTAEVE